MGAGAEMWAWVTEAGAAGCNPHFDGEARMRVIVESVSQEPGQLDGSLRGWCLGDPARPERAYEFEEPLPPEAEMDGWFPLRVDLPLLDPGARPPERSVVTLQVAGFAHRMACYPDEPALRATGSPMAAESFIPSGLFLPGGGEPEQLRAEGLLTGTVTATELRTNPATGVPFRWLALTTYNASLDLVADPAIIQGEPVVGGIVEGTFWLSARIADARTPS
jgi:hypothetical protein